MKFAIGNNRTVILKRTEDGEWRGEDHGTRFRCSQVYGRNLGYGTKWRVRVWSTNAPTKNKLLASVLGHTLKWTLQEAARRADVKRDPQELDITKEALLAVARVAGRVDAKLPDVKDPVNAWLKMSRTHDASFHEIFVVEYNKAYDEARAAISSSTEHPTNCDCNDCEHFRAVYGS